jgi:hypothetical protein
VAGFHLIGRGWFCVIADTVLATRATDQPQKGKAMDDELAPVRAVLSLTVSRWRAFLEMVPREVLERPASSGEWSAVDCLRHLASSEQLWAGRLRDFLDDRREATVFAAATEIEPTRSSEELVTELAEQREENLALLAGLAGRGTPLTIRHPMHGDITLSQVLNGWAAHDLQHTVQAEEALMQPRISRSGYLRSVFADHDLEKKASGSNG